MSRGRIAVHALTISVIANFVSDWDVLVGNRPGSAALSSSLLLVPAFFLSVFIERWIAYLLVRAQKRNAVRRWSWRANLYTYEGMIILLLAIALFDRLR